MSADQRTNANVFFSALNSDPCHSFVKLCEREHERAQSIML